MPIALLIIGAIIGIAALRNTHRELGALIASDFTGSGNFVYWIIAIFIIGLMGYAPSFKTPSRALMALIIIGLFVANGGFFQQLVNSITNVQAIGPTPETAATTAPAGEAPAVGPLSVQVIGGSTSGAAGGISGVVSGLTGSGAAGSVVGTAAALGTGGLL